MKVPRLGCDCLRTLNHQQNTVEVAVAIRHADRIPASVSAGFQFKLRRRAGLGAAAHVDLDLHLWPPFHGIRQGVDAPTQWVKLEASPAFASQSLTNESASPWVSLPA
jgi:hypothetical protein